MFVCHALRMVCFGVLVQVAERASMRQVEAEVDDLWMCCGSAAAQGKVK